MANQAGRPIAPARKLVAAVMGTLAVFVIFVGLGMSSWAVAIFGLVVLALAIALAMVSNVRRGGRAVVAGTAEILDITAPPVAGAYGRAEIRAIVVAPGLGTFDKMIRDGRVPVAKWPLIGSTVPITVDVDDTRRVRVNWKDAPDVGAAGDPPQPAPAQPDLDEDPEDAEDDDVLGAVAPGPWENRPEDWSAEGPVTEPEETRATTPVVVRDTPNGPILEGQLVGSEERATPLPRRAGSRPHPHPTGFDTAATDPVGFDPIDLDPPTTGPSTAGSSSGSAAGQSSGSTTGSAASSSPGSAASSAASSSPGSAAGSSFGSASGPAASSSPGFAAGSSPGSAAGSSFGSASGPAASSSPGFAAGSSPGSAAGSSFGSA
ncbi:hypothetical protein, partial [Actinoplanes regularis]|uniref:hypothetical protein n=1 Tax=Actinoplanes regularis TaxID=52697 RepID=UPI0024A03098